MLLEYPSLLESSDVHGVVARVAAQLLGDLPGAVLGREEVAGRTR